MTRQLLPGQRAQVPAQARPRTPAAPAPQQPTPAPAARLRRPAVLALVAGATVVLAALGWVLVHTPQEVADERTSVLLRPRTPPAASPTASPSATPTGGTSTGAGAPGVRDPFGGTPAAPAGVTTAPTSAPAGAPPPAATVTTTVTAAPAGPEVTATATTTVTSTVTRTSTPTVTPSVTMTAPGSAVYVGFYAWNGNRAAFRINARAYTRGVGATFGPQVTFSGIVPGTPRCTRLTYQGGRPFTLCPGQVVKLP